jgi:rod shape-determining protein MreC
VVSLALLLADHRYQHLEAVRSVLSYATYPLQIIADFPVSAGPWLTEVFASRKNLRDDNRKLRRENLLLLANQQRLEALESENMRLRNLLESSFKIGERVLIAELIAADLDPFRHQVLINKGEISGVFDGQPVLDAKAVLGQIIHVNRLTSTVLMITDASHALPVQVNRNGLRTVAMGTGKINDLDLPNLPNNADIRQGDLLVTSGLGGRFPPGYPVAVVTTVERVPGQPFAKVQAAPSAHLDRSREVLLVWPLTPPEEFELDTETPDPVSPEQPAGGAPSP